MKISDKYRRIVNRIYSQSSAEDQRTFKLHPGMKSDKLLWVANRHYQRAKANEERTDLENRVRILNGYDVCRPFDKPKNKCDNNPVYRKLEKAWRKANDHFTELREKKKLKYKFNSRRNPSAKRHRELFGNALFYKARKIEGRTMKEDEYNMIKKDLEGWLMQTYLETRDVLDQHDERVDELKRRYKSPTEKLSESEEWELIGSLLQI